MVGTNSPTNGFSRAHKWFLFFKMIYYGLFYDFSSQIFPNNIFDAFKTFQPVLKRLVFKNRKLTVDS
jgi:hypothetical protein